MCNALVTVQMGFGVGMPVYLAVEPHRIVIVVYYIGYTDAQPNDPLIAMATGFGAKYVKARYLTPVTTTEVCAFILRNFQTKL